jgi:hypothetical protein
MKKILIGFLILTIAVLITASLFAFTSVSAKSDNVCPEGDGWVKIEAQDPNLVTYNAGSGIITEICIKGGQAGNNEGGYKEFFTSDGWYQVNGVNCVGAFGIGTEHGEARRNSEISGNICSGISHASFLITPEPTTETPEPTTETPEPTTETPEPTTETPEPTTETPEPTTETPEPTTETPEPTTETPEPTTETPEPTTETPEPTTETPEPTTETPEPTTETPEPTTETPEPTTETPEPTTETPEPTTETPNPTEPPIQPGPDLGVGEWLPFIGAALSLLILGGFMGYLQAAKGKLPKKFF